jgi:hypothetical protein
MKLTAGVLREIIKEEVARARRRNVREMYEPSFDLHSEGGAGALSEAEEVFIAAVEADPARGMAGVLEAWGELWNVICDDMQAGQVDLRAAGRAAGFPSDDNSWMDGAQAIADALMTVTPAERGRCRDGHDILDGHFAGRAGLAPVSTRLGGHVTSEEGPEFPGYRPSGIGKLRF